MSDLYLFSPCSTSQLTSIVPTSVCLNTSASSHLSATNILISGNAKIEGMNKDLSLSGIQYNIALSIFFIPYILLEVPSNIILKKFKRPSTYLGILVVAWGIVMTFTGLVKNFAGLMVVRIMLGIAEAGFFPGAVYLITRWYAQRQVQTRLALFYCASALSGAFSGLLAFAIAKMDGAGGKPGWVSLLASRHAPYMRHSLTSYPSIFIGMDLHVSTKTSTSLKC